MIYDTRILNGETMMKMTNANKYLKTKTETKTKTKEYTQEIIKAISENAKNSYQFVFLREDLN